MKKTKQYLLLVFIISISFASKSQEITSAEKDSLIDNYKKIAGQYFVKDSMQGAFYYINKAIKLNPNSAILYGNRGLFYYFNEKFKDSALNDFNHAIQLDSAYTKARSLRGEILSKKNRFKEALQDFDYLIKEDSTNIDFYFNRALCFNRAKMYKEAIADYLRIIHIDTKEMTASENILFVYNNIGYAYVVIGDYKNGSLFIDRALTANPNLSFAWGAKGILNYKQGFYVQSLKDLEKGISLYEQANNSFVNYEPDLLYYYKGLNLLKQHNKTESCNSFRKSAQLGNKDAKEQMIKLCGNQ